MSIGNLDITETDVRDFCLQAMPTDSPKYAALSAEFLRDPENSMIGRFSREGERIMQMAEGSQLNFEKLMIDAHGTKNASGVTEVDLAAFLAGDDKNKDD